MKKISYLTFLFLTVCNIMFAVNARITPFDVTQPDGTTLNVKLVGDERFHYFTTSDDIPLIQDEDSYFYYATDNGYDLQNSHILAKDLLSRSSEEIQLIKTFYNRAISRISHKMDSVAESVSCVQMRAGERSANSLTGKKKGLVILVNFADVSMHGDDPQTEFYSRFNEIGFNQDNHIGSVHDYFYDQSYGQFDLTFDVVGPVTLSKDMAYYGRNSTASGSDANVGWMVKEACELADPYVDYNEYDWDGDGETEQIFFVYAGYGESNGAPSYTIWPHKFKLSSALNGDDGNLVLDNVRIDTYACSCELTGTRGKKYNGIGTACHEFSHCLGLPDIYDASYNGGFGMSYWDIMSSGSYNGPEGIGEIPCGFSAYERWFAGWLEYEELTDISRISKLPSLGDEPKAYIIYNDNNRNEYFILENRQNRDWFSYVKTYSNCHGLLIYHIDYDLKSWQTNRVNVFPTHQRYSIVPADNDYGRQIPHDNGFVYNPTEEDFMGDLFPGSSDATVFDNDSHRKTGGRLFNMNVDGSFDLNKPVTNIKEIDGLISFDFMGGIYIAPPVITGIEITDGSGISVSWVEEPDVESYTIECSDARKNLAESIVFNEYFTKFIPKDESVDMSKDISRLLRFYTEQPGWEGRYIYRSMYGAKVGTDSIGGYIQSPVITGIDDDMTLRISVLPADSHDAELRVTLISEEGDTLCTQTLDVKKEKTSYVLPFRGCGNVRIRVEGEKLFHLSRLQVYNYYYTENDLRAKELEDLLLYQTPPIIINECIGGHHVIEGLNKIPYQVRIRAYKDEAWSAWSESVSIDLSDYNSTESVALPETEPLRIFDMNGMEVRSIRKKGVYIYDYGTFRKKILIK